MTKPVGGSEILKTDSRGRVRVTRERRKQLLDEFEKSDLRARAEEKSPRVPENLRVIEQVIKPSEVIEQPRQWRLIGQEVSEQLDYGPARFLRRRIIRKSCNTKASAERCLALPRLSPDLPRVCLACEMST
jgi:hypothetical protein